MSPRPRRAPLLAALAVLALSGCAWAQAAANPGGPATASAVPSYEPHPATRLVDRLAREREDALPDLSGESAARAAAALRSRGLRARVVSYGPGPVTAQYPEPGAAAPRDGTVLLWTGTPPAPPPPPPPDPAPPDTTAADAASDPPPAAVGGDAAGTGAGTGGTGGGDAGVVEPEPPEVAGEPGAAGGEAHPPRVNPLRLPASAAGEVLEGLASWYGPGFAGRTTACGGTFDPDTPTLATRELRCGTVVLVTAPGGASVEAVATDWGPAEWTGRRFDLSRAAFEAIHPLGAGVARVTVEVLQP